MDNSNKTNAKYYDIIYSDFIDSDLTEFELSIITSLIKSNQKKILDIGCGTGRHSIPLSKMGYHITGIDESDAMLDILKLKNPPKNLKTINADFKNYNFNNKDKFDLTILMWNAFNELCLTKTTAIKSLEKMLKLLTENGSILIDVDTNIDEIANGNFKYSKTFQNKTYSLNWEILKFDRENLKTQSKETITVQDEHGNQIDKRDAIFNQKWWKRDDLINMAENCNFNVEVIANKDFQEYPDHTYFHLTKK